MISTKPQTIMAREINEIPDVITRQIDKGLDEYLAAGRKCASLNPKGFITCARGTSDHAATFFKYILELSTGLPVASIGPSVASVYNTSLKLDGFVCVTISQSGGSPDLVALQKAAGLGGAHTVAFLNEVDSPVGKQADTVLDVLAGPEEAVAATKSFVSSLFAILGFTAGFTADKDLENSLRSFPVTAKEALNCDWSRAELSLARAGSIFTVGRGPSLAVAAEAALKFKETCRIHAEVFSAAEVLHGPVVLAGHRKVNRRWPMEFRGLGLTPLQLERYRARFEWPAISFRGIQWMAFRGVGGGTGWLWDRGWKEIAANGQAI